MRYAISIGLVALLVLCGFGLNLLTVRQGANTDQAINLSSGQRMLSQRLVLDALRYEETGDPRYKRLLVEHLMLFTRNHNHLVGVVEPNTPLWEHYFGAEGPGLDARARRFIWVTWGIVHANTHRLPPPEMLLEIEELAFDLLVDLNGAVLLFEAAQRAWHQRLEKLQVMAMIATLLVIGAKVAIVFYPTHRQLSGLIERLADQAEVDPLTGLANRRHFVARARDLLAKHQDDPDTIFLLALDLDGFKQINDTLGHPAGDVVLRQVAEHLRTLSQRDPAIAEYVLSRPGGDEFLLFGVVRDAETFDVASQIADDVISAVEEPIYVTLGDSKASECRVGVSVGLALGKEANGNVDALIANGDIALYESKRAGKGIATAFTASMRTESERRNRWNSDIRRGLKEMEFKPYFQPQVELATGRVVGLEALARWQNPEHGLISPGDFLDQVEAAHKSDALDGQMILTAVESLKSLREAGHFIERMAVNASGALLRDPQFAATFSALVAAHKLEPSDFTVELLESNVLTSGEDEVISSVRRLQRAGFTVAIDDFGTGYSSLESVALIGGSILKIDRSLVAHLGDPRIDKVLEAGVAMGHGLGARIYAEGVDSAAHLRRLSAVGVEVVQGHFICRPSSLEDIRVWLDAQNAHGDRRQGLTVPVWALPDMAASGAPMTAAQ